MPDLEPSTDGERHLEPKEVSDRSFPTAFRGFDPVQVRAFLQHVADELQRRQELEATLRSAIADHERAAAEAAALPASEPTPAPDPDERIIEAARVEADRLVREARERVATLGSAATAEAGRVLDEARVEAARLRATATDDLKGRFDEAEATAVRKIAEAELDAAAIRVKAREEADATIEAARSRGREMVAEAQAARERMLADLAKRKRAAQSQLEQLRAGRDRLLDTLKVARRSIDEMTTRFDVNEGGSSTTLTPPASGTPAGQVTTTPGALSTDARPRPATTTISTSPQSDTPRPVRTRAVAIGETPPFASRPSIAASQAAQAEPEAAPPVVVESRVHVPSTTVPPPVTEPSAPPPERRSSGLRILRRNKGPDGPRPAPPLVGRDSPAEGVRIIGRPPEDVQPESAPEPPVVEDAVPDDVEDVEPEATVAESDVAADAAAAEEDLALEALLASTPQVEDPPPPAEIDVEAEVDKPLAREDIRPRIEDLFARIRADREAATASAREVLAESAPPATESQREPDRPVESPRTPDASPSIDADETDLQARDAVTEPLAAQLVKRMKRALQDEQNTSLDRLRTSRGPLSVDQILAEPEDQRSPYRALAMPFLEQAANGAAASSKFGAFVVAVDDLAAQLADDLAGALRGRLGATLSASESDELDLSASGERISSVYREWKVQKLERLAMHYLVAAHERGGFLANPEGTPLRWLVDDDGPCPDCEDNALAGPTPRGEPFPTGQLHPPAHLGCRCLLTSRSN